MSAYLISEMKSLFPDFMKNKYFLERCDNEQKKLINMHYKSNMLFYTYYRLLYFYRGIRYR